MDGTAHTLWNLQQTHYSLTRQVKSTETRLIATMKEYLSQCQARLGNNHQWSMLSPEEMNPDHLALALAASPLQSPCWCPINMLDDANSPLGRHKIFEAQKNALLLWYCYPCHRTLGCPHVMQRIQEITLHPPAPPSNVPFHPPPAPPSHEYPSNHSYGPIDSIISDLPPVAYHTPPSTHTINKPTIVPHDPSSTPPASHLPPSYLPPPSHSFARRPSGPTPVAVRRGGKRRN